MGELELVHSGDDPAKYSRLELGNKALGLMGLFNIQHKFEFEVPPFFIIPTTFYKDYWKRHDLESRIHIASCADIHRLHQTSDFCVGPDNPPYQISSLFLDFIDDYKSIIEPPFLSLTGFQKKADAERAFNEKYPEFVKAVYVPILIEKYYAGITWDEEEEPMSLEDFRSIWGDTLFKSFPIEDYYGIVDSFSEDPNYPDFRRDYDALQSVLNVPSRSMIYRSSHPLEAGDLSFSGVFDSLEEYSDCSFNSHLMSYIITSAFNSYAQYYFERHGIEPVREMAVIMQLFADNMPKFIGHIHSLPEKTIIRYSMGESIFTIFWVEIEGNRITRYDNKYTMVEQDRWPDLTGVHSLRPETVMVPLPKLEDDYLLFLADLASRVKDHFNAEQQSFEFVRDRNERLYLVQRGSSYLWDVQKKHPISRQIKHIDESRIITSDASGYTVGDYSGPLVNMLKYSMRELTEEQMGNRLQCDAVPDLEKITLEQVAELDRRYPGAIFLIDIGQYFNKGITNWKRNEQSFHMLTPNKKGIIFLNSHPTSHMDAIYHEDKVHYCTVFDPKPLLSIPDGQEICVTSNGNDAVIYRPD